MELPMSVFTQGAFYDNEDKHQEIVTLFDNLPDRRIIRKAWSKRVTRRNALQVIFRRPGTGETCGCLFHHLTGQNDNSKVFHEARRRYNFPLAFSQVLMALYENHPGKPAPLAREMIRAVRPGINLYQVVRAYDAGDRSERTWPMLKRLLDAQVTRHQLAALA
jgi:hypothetical protein